MSWKGIKKAINRAGNQVLVATGQIDHTVDKAFEFEEKRYREMEIQSNKLQKELKHYVDYLNTITTAQINLGETLSSFYGIGGETGISGTRLDGTKIDGSDGAKQPIDDVITSTTFGSNGIRGESVPVESVHDLGDDHGDFAKQYYDQIKTLSLNCLQEVQHPYLQTVLNPMARFNSYHIEINEAIKKRKHKQLDYDTMRSKLKKLMENPQSTSEYDEKLATSQLDMENAQSTYNTLNQQLKDEIPKFINYRIPFLDASFESFVKIQLLFFNENFRVLNELQPKLDAKVRQDFATGKLDERIDNILGKMKQLNITG
jgi:amphiphysin